jgi:hypothetical protein
MTAQSVYKPIGAEGFELCLPVNGEDFKTFYSVVGEGVPYPNWRPEPVEVVRRDEGRELATSDAPWFGSMALVFRPRAAEALGPILDAHGELLRLSCPGNDLFLYHPIRVLDALDEAASSVWRFADGQLMAIQKYVFRARTIGDTEIFRIPNLRPSPTLVGQGFVDEWNAHRLKGLDFECVWRSEGPG